MSNTFKEMDKAVEEFMEHLDTMLANDKDIKANSTGELIEEAENYLDISREEYKEVVDECIFGNKPIINPSEFDKRLNALLKEFEGLPKEDLIDSLEFYLNIIKEL